MNAVLFDQFRKFDQDGPFKNEYAPVVAFESG
jgi:hypothetical protein